MPQSIAEENRDNSKPCISKVHVGLRNVKPEAYGPVLVSIGPYHKANPDLQAKKQKGKPDLQPMQQNKKLYLNSLLERTMESYENYLAELKEFDRDAARKCYVDLYPVNSNDEFAEMMLLDGCFIVEFLRKMDNEVTDVNFDEDDPISRVPWMKSQIKCDMMLLENQLPYFILSKVYDMTKSAREKPLGKMVMSCFNLMLPRPRLSSNNVFENIVLGEIKHLLHLVHLFCRPSYEDHRNISDPTTCFSLFCSDDQTLCPLLLQNNNSGSDESYKMKNHMGTVVELQEAGVNFKEVGEIYKGALTNEIDDYVSLFDIDFKYEKWKVPCFKCGVPCFKCGVMKVPCFKVDGGTETLLRNLIAYEQHFTNDVDPKYFTDFACLMNQLINSKQDAKVLRFKGIIMNFLGGDDELSQLFNTLINGVCESPQPYYDLKVRQKIEKHCKTKCNTWMAKLNRKYFNNPWAGISTFAAVFLLLLTLVQTVVALITWLA